MICVQTDVQKVNQRDNKIRFYFNIPYLAWWPQYEAVAERMRWEIIFIIIIGIDIIRVVYKNFALFGWNQY